ncbi:hypothetical protein EB75_24175 [Mycobacterium sp. ST-F2]|uniref:hypothetical protein n=1 Tax=Mycobacterium sp. ST-F2 TaxID=1490484 RepID=UPI00093F7733|nr:hypothetical protein [Mycobacterium sp. ST-F2]OKH79449.1 hypothetical protein EB75_24175 [Mycobacterium sp. ST-F2]
MTVQLAPITDADVAAVAEFLHTHHDPGVDWGQACAAALGTVTAPNHGFMLRDGQTVVGTLLAIYSERLVQGRVERFCNMGSWCVLPNYRARSILLVNALLAQEGYHFTVLSPTVGSQEILAWLKFGFFDTSAVLIPNLPWPSLPGRTRITTDPDVIDATLTGAALDLYRDHAPSPVAQHLVLTHGLDSCYVMYRKAWPALANILHVSNPALFQRALIPLTRHLLMRCGLVATLAELRIIERAPHLAFRLNSWPKMYRSPSLAPAQIDYLYSELVCV